MKKIFTFIIVFIFVGCVFSQNVSPVQKSDKPCVCAETDRLDILWTSGEKDVFTKVVLPYGLNSKKMNWWKEVSLIVWGPSTKLLSEEAELQKGITKLKEVGVTLTACKWCSDQYGVSDNLAQLGIEVKYMGKPLTDYLKMGHKVLVF